MRKLSKKTLAVATTVVLLSGGGAAFAYWTNSGTGTGTATTTTTTVALVVNQTSTISGMYPGGPAQTLAGTFDNPNAGAMHVTAVTAASYAIDAAHVTAGCTVAGGNYTLGGTAPVNADVPAGLAKGAWTGLTITMNNLATTQDFCKGATVTITYASS